MSEGPAIFAVAHRGASASAPENTVAAFDEAIRNGAMVIEFDVHLSADGVPVVIHDEKLERTTNGHGYVRDHSAADLLRYDAGSWMHERFIATRIPTLDEALRAILPAAVPVIELKVDVPPPVLLDALRARDALEVAIVISFNQRTLAAIRAADRNLGLGLLADVWTEDLPERARRLDADILIMALEILTLEHVTQAMDAGLEVWCYTANDVGMVAACAAMGVSGIITDRPDLIRSR